MPSAASRFTFACVPIALALAFSPAAAFPGFSTTEEGSAFPDSADGRKAAKPAVQAHRLNGDDIRLDGKLDDSAWQAAPAARGFRVSEPDRGAVPAEETVFKVAYDEGSIYFGIACLKKDPATKISASLTRRDRFTNSDIVAVYIDPYHDHTTGYAFKVNPLGVQLDSYIYNNGDNDDDWDAVWEAETTRDANGWYAEIRIPFSAIRYRAGADMTWGLNVYRYIQALGQDTSWRTWDRQQAGFVSNFGELTGLSGVRAPRQLEILPYVVQRETDHSIVGSPTVRDNLDGFQNFGADLKYGVTSDLTLNATVQPDFGQVEADPAELNLSPFETSFQEKRPFFVEGSRFFQHRNFELFYSRRIGTGDENARIRYAGKLTGKMVGDIAVAALAASTDVTEDGRAHNIFMNGRQLSRFFVGRLGKEFSQGRHRFNVMQTAVLRTASRDVFGDRGSREAYTTGVDFLLSSPKRTHTLSGSFVGSVINPEPLAANPALSDKPRYGTGAAFDLNRNGGKWRGGLGGRWESDKLDINDIGFLSSPDEISSYAFLQRRFNPEGKSKFYNSANLNLNLNRSWMYAGRTGYDVTTGLPAWHYEPGHPQYAGGNINGWMQFKNYREAWFGMLFNEWGNHRYETRGGPIIGEPTTYGGWLGASTDRRRNVNFEVEGNWNRDKAKNVSLDLNTDVNWNQSSAINHTFSVNYHNRFDDTQYLGTFDVATHGGQGIGGLSYVFGDIHQQTVDFTLRSSVLFSRNQSLEVYAQPFLTVGHYGRAREMARADSYDFINYEGVDPDNGGSPYDYRKNDFTYSSVNVNLVYRWQYRPGSTFFLVWKQSRERFEERSMFGPNANAFENGLGTRTLFQNEPENTLLAKVTYWLPI